MSAISLLPNKRRRAERRIAKNSTSTRDSEFWHALQDQRKNKDRRADGQDQPMAKPDTQVNDDKPRSLEDPHTRDGRPDTTDGLTAAQAESRRKSLISMLNASTDRFNKVQKNRRPVLAAGVEVRVVSGPLVGEQGVILDADYIENRVLLSVAERPTPEWVEFSQVGAVHK